MTRITREELTSRGFNNLSNDWYTKTKKLKNEDDVSVTIHAEVSIYSTTVLLSIAGNSVFLRSATISDIDHLIRILNL